MGSHNTGVEWSKVIPLDASNKKTGLKEKKMDIYVRVPLTPHFLHHALPFPFSILYTMHSGKATLSIYFLVA